MNLFVTIKRLNFTGVINDDSIVAKLPHQVAKR